MEALESINLGELLNAATLASAGAVVVVTQLMKYIPVAWTSRYPVYVNVALSIIGAIVVTGLPSYDSWVAFIVQVLTIALSAAFTYELLVRPAVKETKTTVIGE